MATCHACASPDSELVLSKADRKLAVRRCGSCGFAYLESWGDSLSSADELYDYYAEIREEDLARRHTAENRARQLELLEGIQRHAPGRKLLDVGCGDGQLLETAGDAGWDAMGVDLSEAAIDLCQKRGLNATCTDFFSDSLDEERFDVIVMSELIEHVPEPQRFMKRAAELLRPGGILYLTTPNFGSLARRALGESWSVVHPEHIGYFEKATLRAMACDGAGLREVRIDANNISPSTIVAWLKRGNRRAKISVAEQHRSMRQGLDQQLRRSIHVRPGLQKLKVVVNRIVSPLGLGDTLVAWFQKP
jgi:2-polyprenyl-3-methyl-5-hydroxy-6-metoxy-1,4-benzoquinol methylase